MPERDESRALSQFLTWFKLARFRIIFPSVQTIKGVKEAGIDALDPVHRTFEVLVIYIDTFKPEPERSRRETQERRNITDVCRVIIGERRKRSVLIADQAKVH